MFPGWRNSHFTEETVTEQQSLANYRSPKDYSTREQVCSSRSGSLVDIESRFFKKQPQEKRRWETRHQKLTLSGNWPQIAYNHLFGKHLNVLSHFERLFSIEHLCIYFYIRRYLQCKEQIKIRKIKSTEKLVKNLAAETITKGLRRYDLHCNCYKLSLKDLKYLLFPLFVQS